MKIKLNYEVCEQTPASWKALADALPDKVLPSLRETLEAILEQQGNAVDKRERLIPQTVIYAECSPGSFVLFNALFEQYGFVLERQNEYKGCD